MSAKQKRYGSVSGLRYKLSWPLLEEEKYCSFWKKWKFLFHMGIVYLLNLSDGLVHTYVANGLHVVEGMLRAGLSFLPERDVILLIHIGQAYFYF